MDPERVLHHNLSFDSRVFNEQQFKKHRFTETIKKI